MNHTIGTQRLLHTFVRRQSDPAPATRREKDAGKTPWREFKAALVAIALFACIAIVPVVVRQLVFNPRFVELLDHTARMLATGMPF